ncbi:MAG: oligosaccharide flippase family protein [Sphingobacterium sp.]
MGLASKLIKSSGTLVAIKFLQRSLGLISTLILARILTPESFGIVAIAALVIYFSEVISNTGIQQYLVQTEFLDDGVVNSAWTLNLIIKFSICLILYGMLPVLALFYENPVVIQAISVLIPVIGIRALTNPELHVKRRNLDYNDIFKIQVLSKVGSFSVVVIIAVAYKTFWAIIIGDIVSSILTVLLSYRYCTHRPRLSLQNVGKQWVFSRWMMARGCFGYLRAQVDVLLISQFFSLAQLGRFNIAREFTIMPANEVIGPAVEPLLATFSSARQSPEELEKQFSLSVLVVSLLIAPVVAFLFFVNEMFVLVVLGEKWLESAPLVQAMTPLLAAFTLSGLINAMFIAFGKVKQIFYFDVTIFIIIFTILYMLKDTGLVEFVWVRSLLALGFNIVMLYFATKLYSSTFIKTCLYFLLPYVVSIVIGFSMSEGWSPVGFWELATFGIILVFVCYALMYLALFVLAGIDSTACSAKGYVDQGISMMLTQIKNRTRKTLEKMGS